MTGTLCRSAALGCIIALWVMKIAELFGIIVKTILSMVEKIGDSLHEPGVWCRKALWPGLPRAIWPCLSRPAAMTLQDACCLPISARINEATGARRRGLPVCSPMPWERSKVSAHHEGKPTAEYAAT